MEEEKNYAAPVTSSVQYYGTSVMSPEIVEIAEDSIGHSKDGVAGNTDVYVAVGKDDLHVLKWTLDHVVSPGCRVFLVHVFSPVNYINTPVGRLSRSQLSRDQMKYYLNEDNNRRKNLLQKYIRLCNYAKVSVDTVLLESNETAKAILDLIPVLNITLLVIGTKPSPCSRIARRKLAKGEFLKKNAPDYCEVTIVEEGKKLTDNQQATGPVQSSLKPKKQNRSRNSDRKFFECVCFSGNVN